MFPRVLCLHRQHCKTGPLWHRLGKDLRARMICKSFDPPRLNTHLGRTRKACGQHKDISSRQGRPYTQTDQASSKFQEGTLAAPSQHPCTGNQRGTRCTWHFQGMNTDRRRTPWPTDDHCTICPLDTGSIESLLLPLSSSRRDKRSAMMLDRHRKSPPGKRCTRFSLSASMFLVSICLM